MASEETPKPLHPGEPVLKETVRAGDWVTHKFATPGRLVGQVVTHHTDANDDCPVCTPPKKKTDASGGPSADRPLRA